MNYSWTSDEKNVKHCWFLLVFPFTLVPVYKILFQDAIENANLLLEYHISHLKQVKNKMFHFSGSLNFSCCV
jgi:hypothetical protein